jgi:hypothetical protein
MGDGGDMMDKVFFPSKAIDAFMVNIQLYVVPDLLGEGSHIKGAPG